MAKTEVKASPEIVEVLKSATIDDKGLVLPKLDPKVYQKVKKFLELTGWTWNKKAQTHLPDSEESKQNLLKLIESGSVTDKQKLFQAYYTPDDVADQLVNYAGIQNAMSILEPSAGLGSLVKAVYGLHNRRHLQVTCVDINPEATAHLKNEGFDKVIEADFLTLSVNDLGLYDRVLMNPPFTDRQDAKHILHAMQFLRPGGYLVAILSLAWNFRSESEYGKLARLVQDFGEVMADLPQGTFRSEGTNIATQIIRIRKE